MSTATTFWGNYMQKMYCDEIKWSSPNTMIVHFNRVDIKLLENIHMENEKRHYLHKVKNQYQYVGQILTWNIIQVENGFVNLELVINRCPTHSILFHTKNDVCSYYGIPTISPENWMNKINIH